MAFVKLRSDRVEVTSSSTRAIYTQEDVNRIVNEALANQEDVKPREAVAVVESPKPKKLRKSAPSQFAKRPLSRSEREQLAADLRLLSSDDEATLHLLGDRINQ
jgi:hypothetical protein